MKKLLLLSLISLGCWAQSSTMTDGTLPSCGKSAARYDGTNLSGKELCAPFGKNYDLGVQDYPTTTVNGLGAKSAKTVKKMPAAKAIIDAESTDYTCSFSNGCLSTALAYPWTIGDGTLIPVDKNLERRKMILKMIRDLLELEMELSKEQ